MDRLKLLKGVLLVGALYYLLGSVVHFFGLTLFPFYVSELYTPYHDSVIGLASFVFFLLLLVIARDPVKNIDTFNVVLVGAFIASVFSIIIPLFVDFVSLGAPTKGVQTIAEGGLGFVFVALLLWLYPRG